MSEYSDSFIEYLERLQGNLEKPHGELDGPQRNPGAMSALRHSLAFNPGAYPPAYPFVEPFVRKDAHARDASRLALYVVAGLFALYPRSASISFAAGFSKLKLKPWRDRDAIEKRFIAVLGADSESLPNYLRHSVSLMAADEQALNYSQLLEDVSIWMNPHVDPDWRDDIRQRWARDFYRTVQKTAKPSSKAKPSN